MLEHRQMLMTDYMLSPQLVGECNDEIIKYCGGGIERNGKTLHCLFLNAKEFFKKGQFKLGCFKEVFFCFIYL
jgi:hypothetical protein